jgi:hypothetical protein
MASSLKWQQFVSLFLHQLRICRRSIDEVKLKSLFNEDGYRPCRSADRGIYCSLSRFHPSGILVHVPLKSLLEDNYRPCRSTDRRVICSLSRFQPL